MKTYNLVLIGCGHMGSVHLRHISKLSCVHLLAVVDTDMTKAKRFQALYGSDYCFDDYRCAVSLPQCDIVIIATYPSTHLEIVRQCIANGKHILCEKPVAGNWDEVREFTGYMKTAAVKILAGYILRHNDSYRLIHDLIREGKIGKPLVMRMTQNHRTADWPRYRKLITETSPIIDCGVHYLDIMEWVTGAQIEKITAAGTSTQPDLPKGKYNYGIMTVTLSDGSIGYYEAGWGKTVPAVNEKEFIGPDGSIRLITSRERVKELRKASLAQLQDYADEVPDGIQESDGVPLGDLVELTCRSETESRRFNVGGVRKPTGEQLLYLISMIEENAPPVPSAEQIDRGMASVLEADRQIRSSLLDGR